MHRLSMVAIGRRVGSSALIPHGCCCCCCLTTTIRMMIPSPSSLQTLWRRHGSRLEMLHVLRIQQQRFLLSTQSLHLPLLQIERCRQASGSYICTPVTTQSRTDDTYEYKNRHSAVLMRAEKHEANLAPSDGVDKPPCSYALHMQRQQGQSLFS
jgi:hypothetical protein